MRHASNVQGWAMGGAAPTITRTEWLPREPGRSQSRGLGRKRILFREGPSDAARWDSRCSPLSPGAPRHPHSSALRLPPPPPNDAAPPPQTTPPPPPRWAAVVVLGDVAHSPRTTAHASALLAAGVCVHLIAYGPTPPPPLDTHPHLVYTPLPPPPAIRRGRGAAAFLATAAWSVAARAAALAWAAVGRAPATWDVVVLQTPPAIPAAWVLAAALAVRHRGAGLVVDWHNFGWTLLAGGTTAAAAAAAATGGAASAAAAAPSGDGGGGAPRIAVRVAKWVERGVAGWGAPHRASGVAAAARRALTGGGRVGHLVVCTAMREWQRAAWGVDGGVVLRDLPRRGFAPPPPVASAVGGGGAPAAARRTRPLLATDAATGREVAFATVVADAGGADAAASSGGGGAPTVWRVVPRRGAGAPAADAPPLVVTATSWTADEDFGALIAGLRALDARLAARSAGGGPPPPPRRAPPPRSSSLRRAAARCGRRRCAR
ncbi:hypothetical protein BU14_0087s0055 [Porphyra umbilicalis]|uniref:Glycosyltransferase subfamily 4-like N-terminal domain-containing protein n=1 Tax=Porphyra umbilicalis TaxID=2786 RepID=A0A1X6PE26_PORUM|nr:hypothetical protein BU14_0087s0055 [Porphyra umbilicalis]|eukprot:OSX79108.1 hypothetical protein BU14_0087s0055 [Porphyra umbilicalis]